MNNIIALFQLLPAIIAAMKAIEEAIPGQGAGEQKLAAVRGLLEAVNGAFDTATWSKVAGMIGTLVALFNTSGVFKK